MRRRICLSYPARLGTCVPRARVRQFSLAPLPSYNGLSSLQLVTGCTVAGTPWVGLTHTPIDRHIRAFPPSGRVRVAQYFGLGLGSKAALQPPAPRCSCASTIRCTQLPQSDPVSGGIVEPSGSQVSMWWGWQPPRTVQRQAAFTPVLAAHEGLFV